MVIQSPLSLQKHCLEYGLPTTVIGNTDGTVARMFISRRSALVALLYTIVQEHIRCLRNNLNINPLFPHFFGGRGGGAALPGGAGAGRRPTLDLLGSVGAEPDDEVLFSSLIAATALRS